MDEGVEMSEAPSETSFFSAWPDAEAGETKESDRLFATAPRQEEMPEYHVVPSTGSAHAAGAVDS